MERKIVKHYSNGEVTIVWQNALCVHSGNCVRGLPEVFDWRKRPWITPSAATTANMIDQVRKCPSGALSYVMNDETKK